MAEQARGKAACAVLETKKKGIVSDMKMRCLSLSLADQIHIETKSSGGTRLTYST